jgi:hypothetical protein
MGNSGLMEKTKRVTLDGIQQHRMKSLNPSVQRKTTAAVDIVYPVLCELLKSFRKIK